MIYQLRLPITLGVDGLFLNMVKSLEQALGRPLTLEMQGAVARDLEKHLMSFDTCGCSSLCDEAVEPSRWNHGFEPFLLSTTNEDRDKVLRLHLNLPGDSLERLSGALARYLDGHMVGGDEQRRADASTAIMSALAPYTFYGDVCRKIDLCKSAEQRPVSISVGQST
jgi:hypothetical protein